MKGIDDVFSDIVEIARSAGFRDCRHEDEPGCAVEAAVADGTLDEDRVRRWKKLLAEEAHNSASLAERRARGKEFGKMVKRVMTSAETLARLHTDRAASLRRSGSAMLIGESIHARIRTWPKTARPASPS
jgi:hypothetical protein